MKIAVWHNLPSGGGSRALHQHIRGLAERGHEIEVWTTSVADTRFLDVDQYVTRTHQLPLSLSVRIRYEYLDNLRALVFLPDTRIRRMLQFCEETARQIQAGGFDVLFANSDHYFMMPYIGRFLPDMPKVLYLGEPARGLYEASPRLIWEGLEAPTKWLSRAYWANYWDNQFKTFRARVRIREEIANYHTYDTVLVNSNYSNESLLRAYGGPGQVCYLGIDSELFPWLNLPREPFVMGLGSFYPPKRPHLAIEAIAAMPALIRPRLVWVGNIGSPAYMKQLTEQARQANVVFEPRQYVPHSELIRLLNTASALLYTSALEPFGLAPLEANACGLPVVAVAEGGVRETIINGYNGLTTTQRPADIANALARLLTTPDLFQTLSVNGRQGVRADWTVARAVDRVELALQKTIARRSQPQHAGEGVPIS